MTKKQNDWCRLASIPGKLKVRGLSWFVNRIGIEFRMPSTKLGQTIKRLNKIIYRILSFPFTTALRLQHRNSDASRTLYAFIDLDVCPVTYDIVDFLLLAALEQKEKKLDSVHVVVVPGHENGFKEEEPIFAGIYNHDSRRWRLHNICIPIFELLPNISGYTVCTSRDQASLLLQLAKYVSPKGYTVLFPCIPKRRDLMDRARAGEALLPFFKSPPQALKYIESWLSHVAEDRRVICITLRDSRFGPERNSNIDAWIEFARQLDPLIYQTVFILDTDTALSENSEKFSGMTVFQEGAWNVCLRAALYEKAWLSMGVLCGPTELCWYNQNCRYLFFMPLDNLSDERQELMKESGFEIGRQFLFAAPSQKLVWKTDDVEVITSEFNGFIKQLDAKD